MMPKHFNAMTESLSLSVNFPLNLANLMQLSLLSSAQTTVVGGARGLRYIHSEFLKDGESVDGPSGSFQSFKTFKTHFSMCV